MTNALIPELTGRRLTADVALQQPTIVRNRIAELADSQILLPKLFRHLGGQVTGGGMLYSVVQASDFFTSDVEKRAPRAEYKVVEGVDPEPKLALVEDWGGKFQVAQEEIRRNNISYLDQQTVQLANTISRKLDVRAVQELQAAPIATVAASKSWDDLVTVGPLTDITESADRPTAHFAQAQELADLDELGVTLDTLLVHPNQARALKVAYAQDLDSVLKSSGLTMFSNPRIPAGTAYLVEAGAVGTVGFEEPLTTEVWEDKTTRSWWVQAFVVPALAVDRPYAAKKLTGLAG